MGQVLHQVLIKGQIAVLTAGLLGLAGCKKAPPSSADGAASGQLPVAPSAGVSEPPPSTPDPPFATPAIDDLYTVRRPGRRVGKYGGQLVLTTPANPKSFNPLTVTDVHTANMLHGLVYSTLVNYDRESFKTEPALATSWERSKDGLIWTFKLRPGVRWSDGHPLTSHDVLFSYRVALDPKVHSPTRDNLRDSTGALPEISAPDAQTVVFTLRGVNVLFLATIAGVHIIPPHKWAKAWMEGRFGEVLRLDSAPEDVVSSGPFRLTAFETDQRLVLTRNPHFWKVDWQGNRLPYLDRVLWTIVPDYNTALLKFRQGQVHVYDQVRAPDYDLLKRGEAEGGYTVLDLGASQRRSFMAFNLNPEQGKDEKPYVEPSKSSWFRDRRFRLAVSHALDREGIVNTALLGRGRPAFGMVTEAHRAWRHPSLKLAYSPERAKTLLSDMDLEDRDGDGVVEDAAGNPVRFKLLTNVEDSVRVSSAALIASDLRRIGVHVEVKPTPFMSLITQLSDTMDWEAVLLGYGGSVPPDPAMWKNVYLSEGRMHVWHPRQKTPGTDWEGRIDQLVGKLTGTYDFLARKKAHDEILDILGEQQPMIFVYSEDLYVAGRIRVGNLRPSSLRPHGIWNVEELFLD